MTCGCAMSGGSWGWFAGPVGLVGMVAVWALLIWGGVVLVRRVAGSGVSSAEGVLARRFATGEIDEDEYRHRLEAVRSTSPHTTHWFRERSR